MTGAVPESKGSTSATNELALHRTLLAHERTMLAWIRTATSLISFGFSIQQLFRVGKLVGAAPGQFIGPSEVGTAMTVIGLLALLLAALEHRVAMHDMRLQYPVTAGYPPIPKSRAGILGALIALLGIAALLVRFVRS